MNKEKVKEGILKGSALKRHIILLILTYIAVINLSILLYLISPKYYKATSSILQPPESETSIVSSQATKFSKEPLSLIRTNTELFFSILNSRRMKDDIIEKFNLKKHYNVSNNDEAIEILNKRTKIFLSKDKVIQIDIIDRDPKIAAGIANFYTENLDFLIKELAITTAKQNRIFIEKRLKETTELIESLEKRLSEIQNTNKLVVDQDLSQISQTGGKLMEQLINKQLELEREKQILDEKDPKIIMLKNEIKEIQTSLTKLLASQDELTRILRELKVQETLYNFLTSKMEEAKIEETRDTPVVQILDKAKIPYKVYKPDIKFILVLVSSIVGGIGFITIFFDILRFLGSI
ncbi:MAG: hypothetical protein NC827_06600 [Candidatus Omnitrophica bacterium]|nr:hypothetical protein [Candidatus Omnitrophota bacterium]MCM8802960.1 hypothetical protein [Candidatus Omnitrophota bacterium]